MIAYPQKGAIFPARISQSGYNQAVMAAESLNPQHFYAQQGQISAPAEHAPSLAELPPDIPGTIACIQDLMLHLHWAGRYGVTLNRVRQEEANLRTVRDRLAKINALDGPPLPPPLPLSKKTVGTCRDFSLLLSAISPC
jgi:hypothetical protein